MKDPHQIILHPYITERSVAISYGDPRIKDEGHLTRKYTFIVERNATKIEIKKAIESIYNAGKKKGDWISVEKVNTSTVRGRRRRVRRPGANFPTSGYEASRKKAIVTLAKGQMLEDYGV